MSTPVLATPGSVQRDAQTNLPRQQDISKLAYALWQQRGCPEGTSEQDWIEAERLVQKERSPASLSR